MTFRNVCFTLNNYTAEDETRISGLECQYLVYGHETAPVTGTPHLQGYIEFLKQTRMNSVKHMLGDRAHIESRRGTQEQAIAYCKKEDAAFVERGIPRAQGHRTDLDDARRTAVESGMREVTATMSYNQIQTAAKFLTYNEEPRDWLTSVTWIYGPTGSGKSRLAREIAAEYTENDVYVKSDATKWWEGYDGQETVIIDDFRDSWWGITEMLRILDRYECRIECKGGYRQLKAKTIIVTSIEHPEMFYRGARGEPIEQLMRRITGIIKL